MAPTVTTTRRPHMPLRTISDMPHLRSWQRSWQRKKYTRRYVYQHMSCQIVMAIPRSILLLYLFRFENLLLCLLPPQLLVVGYPWR